MKCMVTTMRDTGLKVPWDNVILEIKETPRYPDEISMKFGSLEIMGEIYGDKSNTMYLVKCICGKEVVRRRGTLYQNIGRNQSCGCFKVQRCKFGIANKHKGPKKKRKKEERLYGIWRGIKRRCNNPNCKEYKNYGGRGITVCKKWNDYKAFRKWASNNGYDKNLTIERKDVNRGYNPNNCIWITTKDQHRNKRSNSRFLIDGEWILQTDLAKRLGVVDSTIKIMAEDGRLKFDQWVKGSIPKPDPLFL